MLHVFGSCVPEMMCLISRVDVLLEELKKRVVVVSGMSEDFDLDIDMNQCEGFEPVDVRGW